jgi:hypothetical protein
LVFLLPIRRHEYCHDNSKDGHEWSSSTKVRLGGPRLVGLVADEGDDHAVEVEEEHEQVEA